MKLDAKKLVTVLSVVAFALILGGIAMFAFVVPNASSSFYGAGQVVVATCMVAMGGGLLFFVYLSRDRESNFFLYDRKLGRNVSVDELTFDRINSRMSYFMSAIVALPQADLWQTNIFAKEEHFGADGVYKPLAAYKMLYDLAEVDTPEGWRLFLGANPDLLDALTEAIHRNGDEDMARKLRAAYDNAASIDDYDWVRDFITGNAKHLRNRMTFYVRKNLEWFY
jgi:hypothetical protein